MAVWCLRANFSRSSCGFGNGDSTVESNDYDLNYLHLLDKSASRRNVRCFDVVSSMVFRVAIDDYY
jgi:hypothetical protein